MAIRLHITGTPSPMDQARPNARLRNEGTFSLPLDRDLLHVYGESAFHYFLDIERERSIRSSRECVLVRVDLKDRHGVPTRMSPATSDQLFLALAQSVRETDFIGWYEDQRVAGAVMTEVADERQTEGIRRTLERIRRRFETDFPVDVSSRLDIRVSAIRDERARS